MFQNNPTGTLVSCTTSQNCCTSKARPQSLRTKCLLPPALHTNKKTGSASQGKSSNKKNKIILLLKDGSSHRVPLTNPVSPTTDLLTRSPCSRAFQCMAAAQVMLQPTSSYKPGWDKVLHQTKSWTAMVQDSPSKWASSHVAVQSAKPLRLRTLRHNTAPSTQGVVGAEVTPDCSPGSCQAHEPTLL